MSLHEAAAKARVAISTLEHAKEACANLAPLDTPLDADQLRQRARLIHGILRTREQLAELRERAHDLDEALRRFRERRAELKSAHDGAAAAPATGSRRVA